MGVKLETKNLIIKTLDERYAKKTLNIMMKIRTFLKNMIHYVLLNFIHSQNKLKYCITKDNNLEKVRILDFSSF